MTVNTVKVVLTFLVYVRKQDDDHQQGKDDNQITVLVLWLGHWVRTRIRMAR